MNIATRVDQTVNQLKRVLDVELSAEQERKVRQAVQIALKHFGKDFAAIDRPE